MRTVMKVKCSTDVTNDGYGYKPFQRGRRIEWDRFLELEVWTNYDDERIDADLLLRTTRCK